MSIWLNLEHASVREDFFVGDLKHWLSFNMSKDVGWSMKVEWKDFWEMAYHFLWYLRNKKNREEHFHRLIYLIHDVLKRI